MMPPASPSALTATGSVLSIHWEWDPPEEDVDYFRLYTSADSSWSNAALLFEGLATSTTEIATAGQTRYGWIRSVRKGLESDRLPDSDTSSISATAAATPPGGDAGTGYEFIFAVTDGATPSAPSNSWGYREPNSPWATTAPSLDETDNTLWQNQRQVDGSPAQGTAITHNWDGSHTIGRFGIDGEDGTDGTDGAGVEYIFTSSSSSSQVSSSRRPSNTWGYDQPSSRGGQQYYDGAAPLSTTNQYLHRYSRLVPGQPTLGDSITDNWAWDGVVGRHGDDGDDGQPGRLGLSGYSYNYRYAGGAGVAITVTGINEWYLVGGTSTSAWPSSGTRMDFYGEHVPVGHFLLLREGSLFTLWRDDDNWADYEFGSLITPTDDEVCSFRNFTMVESVGVPNFRSSITDFSGNHAIEIHCSPPEAPALASYSHAYAFTKSVSLTTLNELDSTGEWYLNIGGGTSLPYFGWPSAISGIFFYAPANSQARSDMLGIVIGQRITLYRNEVSWAQYLVTGFDNRSNMDHANLIGYSLIRQNSYIGWPQFDVSTSLLRGYIALYFSL